MELNSDDIYNVDIDPQLLKSYEKLSLEENPKNSDFLPDNIENVSLNVEGCEKIKNTEKDVSGCEEILNTVNTTDKICSVNMNETSIIDENLNDLFSDLIISNVEETTASDLKERGPDRLRRNNSHQQNFYNRYITNVSEIKEERLRFLSGSSFSELDVISSSTDLINDGFSSSSITGSNVICTELIYSGDPNNTESITQGVKFPNTCNYTSLKQDSVGSISESPNNSFHVLNSESFYEETAISYFSPNNSVSSGYETSSPQSFSSSPPKLLTLSQDAHLESVSETTVNEQDILEIVLDLEDTTNCIPEPSKLLKSNLNDKNYEEKIIEFLKENENEMGDSVSSSNKDLNQWSNISESYNKKGNILKPYFDLDCTSGEANFLPHQNEDKNDLLFTAYSGTDCGFSESLHLISSASKIIPKSSTAAKCTIAPAPSKAVAKRKLQSSLSKEKFYKTTRDIFLKVIEDGNSCGEKASNKRRAKVIYVEDDDENQTNLHLAVLNCNIEKIYCLVEIHKHYNDTVPEVNHRDKHGKTAVDYATEKELTLVVNYLKENGGKPNVKI